MDKDIKEYIPQEQTYIERIAATREAVDTATNIAEGILKFTERASEKCGNIYNVTVEAPYDPPSKKEEEENWKINSK